LWFPREWHSWGRVNHTHCRLSLARVHRFWIFSRDNWRQKRDCTFIRIVYLNQLKPRLRGPDVLHANRVCSSIHHEMLKNDLRFRKFEVRRGLTLPIHTSAELPPTASRKSDIK